VSILDSIGTDPRFVGEVLDVYLPGLPNSLGKQQEIDIGDQPGVAFRQTFRASYGDPPDIPYHRHSVAETVRVIQGSGELYIEGNEGPILMYEGSEVEIPKDAFQAWIIKALPDLRVDSTHEADILVIDTYKPDRKYTTTVD
jgi:hypothetical protein